MTFPIPIMNFPDQHGIPTEGLLLFYDARFMENLFQDEAGTIPVTADGQPVRCILDLSGNDYHVTRPDAGADAACTYGTSGKAGPGLRYDGAVAEFINSTISELAGKTECTIIVMAGQYTAFSTDLGGCAHFALLSTDGSAVFMRGCITSGSADTTAAIQSGVVANAFGGLPTYYSHKSYEYVYDGAQAAADRFGFYLQGVEAAQQSGSGTTDAAVPVGITRLSLVFSPATLISRAGTGWFRGALVYDRLLNDVDRSNIFSYFYGDEYLFGLPLRATSVVAVKELSIGDTSPLDLSGNICQGGDFGAILIYANFFNPTWPPEWVDILNVGFNMHRNLNYDSPVEGLSLSSTMPSDVVGISFAVAGGYLTASNKQGGANPSLSQTITGYTTDRDCVRIIMLGQLAGVVPPAPSEGYTEFAINPPPANPTGRRIRMFYAVFQAGDTIPSVNVAWTSGTRHWGVFSLDR